MIKPRLMAELVRGKGVPPDIFLNPAPKLRSFHSSIDSSYSRRPLEQNPKPGHPGPKSFAAALETFPLRISDFGHLSDLGFHIFGVLLI
jgi:hypothetical protein